MVYNVVKIKCLNFLYIHDVDLNQGFYISLIKVFILQFASSIVEDILNVIVILARVIKTGQPVIRHDCNCKSPT